MPTESLPGKHAVSQVSESPTMVRYQVLAYLCALSFVLYVDRVCISQAAPRIEEELGISHTAMGFIFGAFTVAYGLFEIPTGRWGDRYGSRGVLTRIVLWWSVFTALTGLVWEFSLDSGLELRIPLTGIAIPLVFNSFLALLLIRFLFGAGEAGAYPNTARILQRWFPDGSRGAAQGLITTCALLGGALAPMAAQYLIQNVGWRWSFVIFGGLGVVWAVAFYPWFRDDPASHPSTNAAELALIGHDGSKGPGHAHPPVPWRLVFSSWSVWLAGGVISCSAFMSYFYFTWYPTYLIKGRDVPDDLAAKLASLVLLGGAAGGVSGGFVGDWLVRLTGNRRWTRSLIGCTAMTMAALLLLASLYCSSPVVGACLMAVGFFFSNSHLASWWAVVTDISGKHIGAVFGLLNSLGVPGAFASQLFLGSFADVQARRGLTGRDQWDPAFYIYACILIVGALGWLLIDGSNSVVGESRKEAGPVSPGSETGHSQ